MVVVARALAVDPADEPDVEVGVAVELLVEACVGVVPHERPPEMLGRDELGGELGHRAADRDPCPPERVREARRASSATSASSAHVSRRVRCVGLENVRHSIAETADGIQCRRGSTTGVSLPYDELSDAEGLEAQLDRPAAVRRDVEERVRVECRPHVDAAAREPLELERPAAPEHREEHAESRPALAPEGEPGQIRLLHARRIADDPLPPSGRAAPEALPASGCTKTAAPAPSRASRTGPTRSKSRNADEPTETPASPRGRTTARRRGGAAARPTRLRTPSTQASSSRRPPRTAVAEAEARLERQHRDVDPVPVERARAPRELVLGELDREATLTVSRSSPSSRGGVVRPRSAATKAQARGAGAGRTSSCRRRVRTNRVRELLERQRHALG